MINKAFSRICIFKAASLPTTEVPPRLKKKETMSKIFLGSFFLCVVLWVSSFRFEIRQRESFWVEHRVKGKKENKRILQPKAPTEKKLFLTIFNKCGFFSLKLFFSFKTTKREEKREIVVRLKSK